MKQPLMLIPPAQSEALYDAALEDEKSYDRIRLAGAGRNTEEWDDGAEPEASDSLPARSAGTLRHPTHFLRA